MTLATQITVLRLILVPVFVACIFLYDAASAPGARQEGWRYAALIVFTVASLSDALDGYLARNWNQKSHLGALLDPVADKLLLLAALIMLGVVPPVRFVGFAWWFPTVIIGRDAILLTGYLILLKVGAQVTIRPHWTGKLSTFFTFFAIGAVLLQFVPLIFWFSLCGGVLAVASTLIYVRDGLQQLTTHQNGRKRKV